MTIPNTARKAGPLLGTGSQTAWPFTFKVFTQSDVAVSVTNAEGLVTVLALGTDYTVTLNSNQDTSPGGTVNYPISGAALPVGSALAIIGDLDYDQALDLPSGGNFSPLALENQLDRATMQIQQLKELSDRSARMSVFSSNEDVEALTSGIIALAAVDEDIAALSGSAADIATVADSVGSVNTVADSIGAVNSVADNLSLWRDATAGNDIQITNFNGTGSQTAFTLPFSPGVENNTQVFIGGVYQQKNTYSLSGTTLTFGVAPPSGTANIEVVWSRPFVLGATDAALVSTTPGTGGLWSTVQGFINQLVSSIGSSLIGFIQAGTGAVQRTAQDKMRETVSAKDFGAVGDGVTDDTAAFVALRTYAASAKARVYIPKGAYILQQATDLAANDTDWYFDAGAILKLKDVQATTSFITFSNPVNQRVYGMRVNANRPFQNPTIFGEDNCAALVVNANKCLFDSVEIINSPAKGFVLVCEPGVYTRDVTVTNFKASDCKEQALLVDGNNSTGLFERIVIDGVQIGATSHAGVALNDGAHSISLSNVISDVQNSIHDAVSVRDSYDIQMSNIRGRRGRNGVMLERVNGLTGRIELNNVVGEFNTQNGVLIFGAENITGGTVVGRNNAAAGINIAGPTGFKSKNVNIAAPSGYDDRATPAQLYGILVQGVTGCRLGRFIAYGNTTKNIWIIRSETSDVDVEIRRVASGTTGSLAAGAQAVVTLSWPTAFDDAEIDLEAVYVFAGTTGFSLAIAHVVAITAAAVQVMVFNQNGTTAQTGTLTVIGRRRV